MIDLYYWPTPNGWKISIMLEECGLEYNMIPVNIGRGDQFKPEFLAISPNNRMPAIVDHDVEGEAIAIFESGAILIYLAELTDRFFSNNLQQLMEITQWVFWQVGGLGPMAGQLSHFMNYAPDKIDYALNRYSNEYNRLLGVLDRQLQDRDFLCGDYSIADMASWPWVRPYERLGESLDNFANVKRWHETMKSRPADFTGCELGKELHQPKPDNEARKYLFGQTAQSTAKAARQAE